MDARAPQLPGDRHRSQRRAPGTYPPQPRRPRRTDPAPGRRQRPEALLELPEPDAIFIGGGVTAEGVLETCWERLRPGGRLLANAVTLQSERVLLDWQQRLGGDLTRLGVAHARPLGGFDTWRQALPITLLELRKPAARKPPRDA